MTDILPFLALRDRTAFRERIRRHEVGWRGLLSLVCFVCFACAVYGAVLGGWRSSLLAAYVAVKLPMLFIGTILIGLCRDRGPALFARTFLTGVAGHALFGFAAGFFAGPSVALLDDD